MIRLSDVVKEYESGTTALKGISLRIEDGEFVFLVGPSGSGKSTIIKLLTGEIVPTSGQIAVNGFSLTNIAERQIPLLRRSVGVIFQDYRLIKDMTVYENVAFAMRVIGASNREIKKRVPSAVLIFITAPSFEEIRSRLVHRGDVAPEIMAERLEHAKWEYAQAYQYDYTVMNDTVDHAVARIGEIMTAAKQEKMDPVHG